MSILFTSNRNLLDVIVFQYKSNSFQSFSERVFTCVNFLNSVLLRNLSEHFTCFSGFSTALKVSKYGVFCGPHFPAFGVDMER